MKKIIPLLFTLFFVLLTQAQVSKTVNLTTAGTLSTSLTATEKNTVTTLTITGTIDARDFKIMRDSMPVLSGLDLSTVTIAGYTGSKGTDIYGGQDYLANTIPQFSFYIGNGVGKTTLTTITLPNTAISIGENAFEDCSGLTSVTIPNSITTIGSATFFYCTGLKSIILPNRITSIGNFTFYSCIGLTTITIPNSVTSIGESAFQYCSGLTTIIIPDSVTSIKKSAFQDCTAMTTITVPNSVIYIGDNAFGNTNLFNGQPNGVIYVGKCAYIYKGGTLITNSNITIADGTIQICYCAFYNCSGMISITIPNTVKSIGYNAFYKCWGLTTITIPNSVDSIGENAFYYCTGLTSIYANSTLPIDLSSSSSVFYNVNKATCTLYVPVGSKSAYQAANQWGDFTNIIETTTAVPTINNTILNVYPNPTTESFQISGIEGPAFMTLRDLNGKKVLTKQITGNENISVSSLSKGVYILEINTNGSVMEKKIVKD